jgi:glycosyltransferase involved in cell wall biosynthesis
MTRIIQITPYPLKMPRHGGQLRCTAIRKRYRELGFDVETVAAVREGTYGADREEHDIDLPGGSSAWHDEFPRFLDLYCGDCLVSEDSVFEVFARTLDCMRPDAIQLEHPWLYPGVKRWLAERRLSLPRLIYSSHNVEWKLKRDEMHADFVDKDAWRHEVERVEALEREIVRTADLVIACTEEDLAELRAMAGEAASGRAWAVARNAIAPYRPNPGRVAAMKKKLGVERYPLFVGSAHPPNADGFWEMFSPSLAFLKPEGERIVVAGGVSHILRQHRVYNAWSGINEPRLHVLGEVDRDDLVSLLGGASVILLPITVGGGSNLKTAEAIYGGKPVLATPHALRGYGDAERWPTITVASTPGEYRRALRRLLDAPEDSLSLPPDYAARREEVTWKHTLAPLAEAVVNLLGKPSPRTRARTSLAEIAATRARIAAIRAAIARRGGADYERLLERQYSRFLRESDVVVEVGGRHLARLSGLVGETGCVHVFEPLPEIRADLPQGSAAANIILYNDPLIDTETLDRHIDALDGLAFVKIDAEGEELKVLGGAAGVLAAHRPMVSVRHDASKCGPQADDVFALLDFAEEHGYTVHDVFGHRLNRAVWADVCSLLRHFFMTPVEREADFAGRVPPSGPEALD